MKFVKLNKKPLTIYESETKGSYFNFNNKRYYMNDFIRVHNNMQFNDSNIPDYIHGISQDYYNPLYIQYIPDFNDKVNVYKELIKE